MLKRLTTFALAACLVAPIAATQRAYADDNKEYLVKAAFIYNFVKFVEWPDGKAISKQSGIDICVIGDSPLMGTGSVFKSASTPKLSLSLVQENSVKAVIGHCHVAFIGESQAGRLDDILAALKGQPVLTVSDIDGFVDRGGMIGFAPSDNKVKLEVNTKSASAAGMRVDAQLLEIAKRVIDK